MIPFFLNHWEASLKIIGAIILIFTFGKGVFEYRKQRDDKRAQQFLELRKLFRENQQFQKIMAFLYHNGSPSQFSDNDKIEFMAFFEDIAFLMNSGLIRKEVAFYMFGFDAITACNNALFWPSDLKKDKYWSLLTDFVKQMEEIDKDFRYDRKKIRL